MSTKKKITTAQKRSATKKTISKSLERRARSIINDKKRYDSDTREAILSSLNTRDAEELREDVRRAERGEMILDTIAVERELEREAEKVLAFMNDGNVPDFISDAVRDAIDEAGCIKGVPTPTFDPDHESHAERVQMLADLFPETRRLSLRRHGATRAALASHLSAVLKHPETPAALYNAIGDEVCEWSSDYCNAVSETPAYIESCLEYYHRKEAKRTKGGEHNA